MKVSIIEHPRQLHPDRYNDVANAPLSASLNCGYAHAIALERAEHSSLLDFRFEPVSAKNMVEKTLQGQPDLILIHWVYNWDGGKIVSDYMRQLKEQGFSGLLGAFGFFPSSCSKELLQKNEALDLVLVGEFEETLKELLSEFSTFSVDKPIPGIRTRSGFPGKRPLIEEVDQIPFPVISKESTLAGTINIAGARGCYGKCKFCWIHPYYGKSIWRPRTVENVMKEIDQRVERENGKYIYFVDPNFMGAGQAGQDRAKTMARELKKRDIKFGFEARVNDIHPDSIASLAEAGLTSVFLGIESASPESLKRMGKRITPEQSERAIRILRDAGIFVSVGFIMFEPDSSLNDLETNFQFLERNGLLEHHDQSANLLYHDQILLQGTLSYHRLKERGRLILSEHSPYEGFCQYRHKEVAFMAKGMRTVTQNYFRNIDRYWKTINQKASSATENDEKQYDLRYFKGVTKLPEKQLNSVLTDSFLYLLHNSGKAEEEEIDTFVAEQNRQLNHCFEGVI